MLTALVLLFWVLTCAIVTTWVARRIGNRTIAFWYAPFVALILVLLPVADEMIALPSYVTMCSSAGFNLVVNESTAHGKRLRNQTQTMVRTLFPRTVSVAVVEIKYVDADSGEIIIEGIGAVRPWSAMLTSAIGYGESPNRAVLLKPCMQTKDWEQDDHGLPRKFERLRLQVLR